MKGSSTYVGGLVGYLNSANASLSNCFNAGKVSGTTNCGGVIGSNNANATVLNIFNVGSVEGTGVGACVGGSTAKSNLSNAFSTVAYQVVANQTLVSPEQMASGEITYLLGEAFFQTIGEDPYPVFEGLKVYYDEGADEFYNLATDFDLDLGEGGNGVEVSDGKVSLPVDGSYRLSVVPMPLLARLPEVSWSSSDEDVASVVDGLVSALSKGEVSISAGTIIDEVPVVKSCTVEVMSVSTLVESLFGNGEIEHFDIFDISGRVIKLGATPEFCRSLNPGLYIIHGKDRVRQILVK